MEKINLGQVLKAGEGERDAIHIAIAPAVAGAMLKPGTPVTVDADGTARVARPDDAIGVVDPYLPRRIDKGERFFVCLNPYTITSLRHEWTHPAFPTADDKAAAKKLGEALLGSARDYLQNVASQHNMSLQDLVDAMKNYIETGDTTGIGTDIEYGEFDRDSPIWGHFTSYTGIHVPAKDRTTPFTCAC